MKFPIFFIFICIRLNVMSQNFLTEYTSINKSIINSDQSFRCNIDQLLPYYLGTIMESYINMYEATKDKKYLDKFIIHAKRIQDVRDDEIIITIKL